MVEYPVWVVQYSDSGRTGPYDVYEDVEVIDDGVLAATRHDGRREYVARGEWRRAGEKLEQSVLTMSKEGVLCAEAERWMMEVAD